LKVSLNNTNTNCSYDPVINKSGLLIGGWHSFNKTEIDFPVYELRELYDETHREMNTAAIQKNETDVINDTMMNFGNLLSQLYRYHGQLVTVSVNTTTNYSEIEYLNTTTVTVALAFDDGVTKYTENLNSTSTAT